MATKDEKSPKEEQNPPPPKPEDSNRCWHPSCKGKCPGHMIDI